MKRKQELPNEIPNETLGTSENQPGCNDCSFGAVAFIAFLVRQ